MSARIVAIVLGIVLVLVGILGFISNPLASADPTALFVVNPAHNLVHIVSGLFLLVGAYSALGSAMALRILGIVYVIVAVLGFITGDGMLLGFISNSTADTWLHVVLAIVIPGGRLRAGGRKADVAGNVGRRPIVRDGGGGRDSPASGIWRRRSPVSGYLSLPGSWPAHGPVSCWRISAPRSSRSKAPAATIRAPGARLLSTTAGAAEMPPISMPAIAASARSPSISPIQEGREIVRALAARSDVLIENFKVGGLAKLRPRLCKPQPRQPAPRLLLDHRFRPDRPERAAPRLRFPGPGDGRDHGPDRRAGRRAAEDRRRLRRHLHRRLRRRPRSRQHSSSASGRATGSTSTCRFSTSRSACLPTRR